MATESAQPNLQTLIGYVFNNKDVAAEALHVAGALFRSSDGSRLSMDGNRRSALLGDAVLKLVLLEPWYEGGNADTIIQAVASNSNLCAIGRKSGLENFIVNNPSQLSISDKTLATTVEAVLGAVYLDSGRSIDAVKSVMRALGLAPV